MALINATSFLLVKDSTVIGHSKETNISLNLDLADITTKESGGWQENLPMIRGGSISASGITDYTDTLNFKEFTSYVITKAINTYYFRDPDDATGTIYRGEGFITSVDETADNETISEFNLEITLSGPITVGNQNNWENIFQFWENIATNWENT
jgi:predicted secreted protein